MKKNTLLLFSLLMTLFGNLCAVEFEGKITYMRETRYDTIYYSFSVLNHKVRIDERDSHQQIIQSLIVDISTGRMTALSPAMKLYTNVETKRHVTIENSNLNFYKTAKYKYINGYKCYLWRLRDKAMNRDISYWVCDCDFTFIESLTALLARTSDFSKYCSFYEQIPQSKGFIPVETIERNMFRDQRSKMSLKNISYNKPNQKLFEIPNDYKLLRS